MLSNLQHSQFMPSAKHPDRFIHDSPSTHHYHFFLYIYSIGCTQFFCFFPMDSSWPRKRAFAALNNACDAHMKRAFYVCSASVPVFSLSRAQSVAPTDDVVVTSLYPRALCGKICSLSTHSLKNSSHTAHTDRYILLDFDGDEMIRDMRGHDLWESSRVTYLLGSITSVYICDGYER